MAFFTYSISSFVLACPDLIYSFVIVLFQGHAIASYSPIFPIYDDYMSVLNKGAKARVAAASGLVGTQEQEARSTTKMFFLCWLLGVIGPFSTKRGFSHFQKKYRSLRKITLSQHHNNHFKTIRTD